MKMNLLIRIVFCLLCFSIVSCNGGDGKDERELTVFDVIISVLEIQTQDPAFSDCPEIANLKLSLQLNDANIDGEAELLDFGHIGDSVEISGVRDDSAFYLNPFQVTVTGDEVPGIPVPFPCCVLSLTMDNFEGILLNENEDGAVDGIEGMVSGDILAGTGDLLTCGANFTGEFTGISRSPEGCVSPQEAPTLDCPAEGFVNQCEQYDDHFCFGWCEPPEEGGLCVDFVIIPSECEVVDCLHVMCPQGPVNLEGDDDYSGFQIIIEDHIVDC